MSDAESEAEEGRQGKSLDRAYDGILGQLVSTIQDAEKWSIREAAIR